MGANDFYSVSYGNTPREAFHTAVEEAKYEYGHGGYTGTIAEKAGFRMISWSRPAAATKVLDGRKSLKRTLLQLLESRGQMSYADIAKALGKDEAAAKRAAAVLRKLGLAETVKIKSYWETKSAKGVKLSYETASDKAYRLVRDDDRRVSDKWGPAGCIRQSNNRFLFFGLASS